MSRIGTTDFMLEVAKGNVEGHSQMNKYGHNEAVAAGPEDVWGGDGLYDFYFTTNQTVQATSTGIDDGSAVRTGTATGGSVTTLIDTGADFTAATAVAVGDVVINDTTGQWGTVNSVAATTLTHTPMTNASSVSPASTANANGDSYRIGSNADDGASVIHVEGLTDSSGIWTVATETVILDVAAGPVTLSNGYVRMYRSFVLHAGTAGMNANDIIIDVVATGEIGLVIAAGDGQTQQAIFTVPSGKTAYFLKGYVGIGSGIGASTGSAVFTWRSRLNNGATGVFSIKGQIEVSDKSPYWIYEYAIPPALPEKSDVLIRCDTTSKTLGVVGAFDLILVDN